jgi:hypothetical protein
MGEFGFAFSQCGGFAFSVLYAEAVKSLTCSVKIRAAAPLLFLSLFETDGATEI